MKSKFQKATLPTFSGSDKDLEPCDPIPYVITRGLPDGMLMRIELDAMTLSEAKFVADEVQYCFNYALLANKDRHGKKEPEDWALRIASNKRHCVVTDR